MAYYRFFLAHPRILSFGIVLTLFSSFGQTFLIAIFVPDMLAEFPLSTGQFGALYAAATLASAACLPFFGRLLDRMELRRYSLLVGGGLMLACFMVALAPNVPGLFLGILGLRLTGQGLLSLTASATMARRFTGLRGRALSISGLGYPLGEGLLPMVGPLIDRVGALRVFPYYLLPVGLGVVFLLFSSSFWVAYAFLALAGASQGTASAIMTALWTELYGRNSIGSVKGIVSMLGVFGTALGPVMIGGMLQAGITFAAILSMLLALSIGAVLVSFYAQRQIQAQTCPACWPAP